MSVLAALRELFMRSIQYDSPQTGESLALINVFDEIDEQEAEHALSLNNFHKEGTGDPDYQRVAVFKGRRCSLIAKLDRKATNAPYTRKHKTRLVRASEKRKTI